MSLNELLLDLVEREIDRSRQALEQVPAGKYDWKPHDRSMIFGYLANMVATIPSWITAIATQDDLDIAPVDAPPTKPERMETGAQFIAALDESAAGVRKALGSTSEAHLKTAWQLKAAGHVVMEMPRYAFVLDTISHWAHHRGQMTVYLRLMGAKVPALYGPSADENAFR